MGEIKQVIDLIERINKDCKYILELRQQTHTESWQIAYAVETKTETLIEEMRNSLQDFRKTNFDKTTQKFILSSLLMQRKRKICIIFFMIAGLIHPTPISLCNIFTWRREYGRVES